LELASTKHDTDQGTVYNSCIHEQQKILQAFQMLEKHSDVHDLKDTVYD
jgi:hypothetical protein